jgi:hypothetical protein
MARGYLIEERKLRLTGVAEAVRLKNDEVNNRTQEPKGERKKRHVQGNPISLL